MSESRVRKRGQWVEALFFAFTCRIAGSMLPTMLLIATALAEELETALNLCSHRRKIRCGGIPVWTGVRAGGTLHFLKLGAGPDRSACVLEKALTGIEATSILVAGYAGALDPELRQGELVVVERAALLSKESWDVPFAGISLGGGWPLAGARDLRALAHAAGLSAHTGTALTSACIIGDPKQKHLLFQRYRASVVDMETAALARVASVSGVPLSCVRAVSDEAEDDFLAGLSYDPASGPILRAAKAVAAGDWLRRYSQWRERSLAARQSLKRFLTAYLDNSCRQGGGSCQ